MSEITVENFFVKSTGVFEKVKKLPEGLVLNFQSKSSTYYVNAEKTHLWRVSDHWGHSIRECAWFLRGYPKISSFVWSKIYKRRMKIGMIAFADLSPNNTEPKKAKVKAVVPVIKVQPAPTMQPCVFSKGGFCRTQLIPPFNGQCGVRKNSFAHEVCNRMTKENREAQIMKPSFMTTEEDDYNSRK